MRMRTLLSIGLAGAAVMAACGGSRNGGGFPLGADDGGLGGFDGSGSSASDATVPTGAEGGSCSSSCMTAQDCVTSCPAAGNGGIYCCDVPSGACMQVMGSTCPVDDAGTTE